MEATSEQDKTPKPVDFFGRMLLIDNNNNLVEKTKKANTDLITHLKKENTKLNNTDDLKKIVNIIREKTGDELNNFSIIKKGGGKMRIKLQKGGTHDDIKNYYYYYNQITDEMLKNCFPEIFTAMRSFIVYCCNLENLDKDKIINDFYLKYYDDANMPEIIITDEMFEKINGIIKTPTPLAE